MYTYFLKQKSGRPRRELYLLLSSSVFCETEKPENCWCSQLRMKISWLLHRESSLVFVSGDIGFPGTKKTKGYMPLLLNAWQKWSVTAVLTLAVLSAAPQLCSTCRTGILPRWSRHQMFHGLCTCSFWNRRLTSCFLKSYELTRLVCLGLCLLISELCRHLANIAPGNTAWSPSVCHLVSGLGGCSFTKDGVEDST